MKKQVKSLDIVDQMLKFASELRMEDVADETDIPEEMTGAYSAEFDSRMNAYFKKLKRKNAFKRAGKTLARVAVILLAFIAVSTTVVMSVDAFRIPALEFFGQVDGRFYSATVLDERGIYDSVADRIKGMYLPSYIPEGFVIEKLENQKTIIYIMTFKNDNGDFILFQNLPENSGVSISNSGTQKEVEIKDEKAKLFSIKDQHILLFKYQNKAFMLTTTLDEEAIILIADSLQYYS